MSCSAWYASERHGDVSSRVIEVAMKANTNKSVKNIVVLCSILMSIYSVSTHAYDVDDPPVWKYAENCFEALELSDISELEGPFNCEAGVPLELHVNGIRSDIGHCTGDDCPTNFPTVCDSPAWLDASFNCYGNSFMQLITPSNNKNVKGVLLCRHNKTWTDKIRRFDDIAMIVHNKKNGETCWFQSQINTQLNGRRVKGPSKVRSHLFWQRPIGARDILCIACHDSGPFVVSPWIRKAFTNSSYFNSAKAPYKNTTKPFDKWPVPRFIEIGDAGLEDSVKPCTSCHKIAAGGLAKIVSTTQSRQPKPRQWDTCNRWIKWATSERGAKGRPITNHFKSEPVYMPFATNSRMEGHLSYGAEWNQAYKEHVEQLLTCCAQIGKNPSDTDANCKIYKP